MKLSILNKKITFSAAIKIAILVVVILTSSPLNVSAAQPISCPLRGGSGDVLANFYSGETLFGNPAKGDVYHDYNIRVPIGEYKVTMTTYDNHSGHGGQNQQHEQVYVALRNTTGPTYEGIIAQTGATRDIPENSNSITSTISNSLRVRTATRILTVVHAAYPSSGPESVVPICVLFEKLDRDEPEPVNGVCGSADGDTVDALPTGSAACRVGTYSSGPADTDSQYIWNCVGSNGGTTDHCSAYREQPDEIEVTCSVSDTSVIVGDSVTWTGRATGGTGGFTYSWSGAVTGTGSTRSRTFTSEGNYTATVTARDSSGNTESRTCATVAVRRENNDVNVSCSVSDTSVMVGDSVTFTANVTDGDSPFVYEWDGDIEGEDDDNRTVTVQYDQAGTYYVHISVEDNNGDTDSATCATVRVEEGEDDLNVICRVSDTSVEVGDEVRFSAEVDGGNSPFEYEWDGDIEGEDDDTRDLYVEYNDEGTYRVSVTVTDDDGNTDSADCSTVRVDDDEDEEDFEITCRVSDTSVETGDEVEFTVDIDGGNGPFEYEWDGDIEGEDDDTRTLRVEYDDEGRYEVEITVTDDDGNEATDECSVVRVEDDDNNRGSIRVRTDNTPTGQLASLDSVFLNQVPSTGIKDARSVALFVSFLSLWSLIVGAYFYRRHQKSLRSAEIARFKALNRSK